MHYASGSGQSNEFPSVEMSCSAGTARQIFRILEGAAYDDIYETSGHSNDSWDKTLESTASDFPSITNLREILRVADFYGLIFLPRMLKVLLYESSDWRYARALCINVIVNDLKDVKLLQHAVERIGSSESPIEWDQKVVHAIGIDIWWSLVQAYAVAIARGRVRYLHNGSCQYSGVLWTGETKQWKLIAENVKLV